MLTGKLREINIVRLSSKMIGIRCVLRSGYKIIALNFYRNIQTTQILVFRVSHHRSRRVGTHSRNLLLRRRLTKDSELIDVNDENDRDKGEPIANFLEEAYYKQMRELKDENKKISKIIMKKSFVKRPSEPNMLTFNERQHMIFLHKSDPVEWSAQNLSESFPALPWAIKKILKSKWIPENEEKIKKMDKDVLQNWEKLKENKLEASQELLDHLKKFIDKRENLEIQLKNPNFFHLPEMKKKIKWKSGPLNSLLVKYEKEVEKLKDNVVNVKSLPESTEGREAIIFSVNHAEKQMELANGDVDENWEESVTGNPDLRKGKREKQVTLQELKKNIFEKTEKKNDLVSPLKEVIIQKSLIKHDRSKREISKSEHGKGRDFCRENESQCLETTSTLLNGIGDEIQEKDNLNVGLESVRRWGMKFSTDEESFNEKTDDESESYSNIFKINELGTKLFSPKVGKETEIEIISADEKKNVNAPHVNLTGKKAVKPVNFINTKKDNEIYENHEKLLSETVFWNAKGKRSKSLDAGFTTVGTAPSPHIASHIQTYFTYDYPLKIKIPEKNREKGKLYRVKDCYYDDTGKFLYRVPGMTE